MLFWNRPHTLQAGAVGYATVCVGVWLCLRNLFEADMGTCYTVRFAAAFFKLSTLWSPGPVHHELHDECCAKKAFTGSEARQLISCPL